MLRTKPPERGLLRPERRRKSGKQIPRRCSSEKDTLGDGISFIHPHSKRAPGHREKMPGSRRDFLTQSALGFLGSAIGAHAAQKTDLPPGAPPAFGTAPPVGPEVTPTTFAEAEKLVQVEMTAADRAAGRLELADADGPPLRAPHGTAQTCARTTLAPAHTVESRRCRGGRTTHRAMTFVRSAGPRRRCPQTTRICLRARHWQLSRWIESRSSLRSG